MLLRCYFDRVEQLQSVAYFVVVLDAPLAVAQPVEQQTDWAAIV